MIALHGDLKILIATKPIDFRKGVNGLVLLVEETLKSDPYLYQSWLKVTHGPFQVGRSSIRCADSDNGGIGWARPWRLRGRTIRARSFAR